jgi:hypothetical protein
MSALFFFNGTVFAKIAWTGTKAEGFPGTAKKNASLKVSNYCFHICLPIEVYQYCSTVSVQDLTHLFG